MIEETFVADNPKSAYENAIRKYGKGIKLLSAKQVKYNDGKLRCEVAIAVPKAIYMEKSFGTQVPQSENIESEEDTLLAELNVLKDELAQMKQVMLGNMPKEIQPVEETIEPSINETIEENNSVVEKIKDIFTHKGISKKWIEGVLVSLVGNNVLNDEKLLLSYILEEIDESLTIQEETLNEPKVMMIVGPTGVGKTTTIAKLAARYAYMMDRPYKVAFLNLDSYKIGAFDQLGHYADIMQIEHVTVDNLEGFLRGLEALREYDIILVDTAGMSPYDTQKFIRTVEYVQSDVARKIEVNLLLSATVKYEDMSDIYKNFSFLNLHSLIISKFDETRHLGGLLNFMLLYDIPMSYFSVGQEVPDDLLVASKEYLLERFIGDLES